ncbi:GntR family transcriptional regulator [Streptomyces sp. NPDC090442]|uniref:GntR family transcriptional regulator n=1 Tax=Streptomyces sp. NPDC090442 TaxID=3365962 RepID=UPI0038241C2B
MHPYERIAEHYRQQIRDGVLSPREKLPTVKELAEEHNVATATVRNAMGWLKTEGYISISHRGTFVAEHPPGGAAPRDRLARVLRTGSLFATGETARVTAAELVVPPLYVSELFDLDPGDQVIRREYVTGRGSQRLMLAVDWYPAQFAAVPDILSTAPGKADQVLSQIEEHTGRRATSGRDAAHSRAADEREANLLGLPPHSMILAGAHEWSDNQGLITYGEWCLPPRFTIGYEYEV